MSIKNQKIIINLILILVYITSFYTLKQYRDDYTNIGLVQNIVFIIVFCNSVLLAYLNDVNRRKTKAGKCLWITFETLGVLGFIYSGTALYLMYALQSIGF